MKIFSILSIALAGITFSQASYADDKHEEFQNPIYEGCTRYRMTLETSKEQMIQLCREVSVEEQIARYHDEQERRMNRMRFHGKL